MRFLERDIVNLSTGESICYFERRGRVLVLRLYQDQLSSAVPIIGVPIDAKDKVVWRKAVQNLISLREQLDSNEIIKQNSGALQILSPVPESVLLPSSQLLSVQKIVSVRCRNQTDVKGNPAQDKCVVLFSGSGSVERVLKQVLPGAKVFSLDVVKQDHINVLEDVREWNRYPGGRMYNIAPGFVKVLWASPPCQHYSRAHTVGERNLELADELVKCALLAIEYLRSIYWFVKNHVGLLRDRPFMQEFVPWSLCPTADTVHIIGRTQTYGRMHGQV